jgi:pimeloyl-ACP methyl ester carboxylesterase
MAWPGVLSRGNLAMQRHDEESTLPIIDLPVLVFSGKHDRMTVPAASAKMEKLLPADHPFQVSSGHLGMWECPQEFTAAVTEFVEQCSAQQKAMNAPRETIRFK